MADPDTGWQHDVMRSARSLTVAMLAAALLLPVAPAAAATPSAPCTGDPSKVEPFEITVGGQPATGIYTLPREQPRGLVVFGHGYSYTVDAWRAHAINAATRAGLVAVAMNYRGLTSLPKDQTGFERARGWPVKTGSEDLVAAGQFLDRVCGGFARRLLLGISMGGNSTGMAAALAAKTTDGKPLFDYWVGVEGVYNLAELYQTARAVAPTNPFAAQAVEDIERETGGTFEQQPAAYAERTVVNRAAEIAKSGLKGVALVHGVDDGQASFDQAQQMTRALRAEGLATDLYTVRRKAPGDTPDTTLTSPENAGHAPEWSTHHIVLDTGFDRITALARRDEPPPCDRDFEVDGQTDPRISPDPSKPASNCPAKPSFAGTTLSGGGGGGGGGGGSCVDRTPPTVTVRARHTRRTLTVFGTARDRGCRAGMRRVRVAVGRRVGGGRCRFVTRARSGRLSRPRSCTRGRIYLRPRRIGRFRLVVRGPRRGRYLITVAGTDRAGNRARLTLHRTL